MNLYEIIGGREGAEKIEIRKVESKIEASSQSVYFFQPNVCTILKGLVLIFFYSYLL